MAAFALNLDTGFTLSRFILAITAIIMVISFAALSSISYLIASVFFYLSGYSAVIILMGGYVSESIGLSYMVSILQGIQPFRLAAASNILYSDRNECFPASY